MSPNSNEVQPMQSPAPPVEQAPGGTLPAESAPQGTERAPDPEQASQTPATAAPSLPALSLPLPSPAPAPQPAATTTSATQGNPLVASDDTDLIEKEWVHKAKQIVEQTRDDPYKQSEELTVFKADYMKKRHNKTIKLNK